MEKTQQPKTVFTLELSKAISGAINYFNRALVAVVTRMWSVMQVSLSISQSISQSVGVALIAELYFKVNSRLAK